MQFGLVMVGIALFIGVYLGLPHIVSGTSETSLWVKNGVPTLVGAIVVLLLVQVFFGGKHK